MKREELIEIRHYLHSRPEVSGQEKATAQFICEELKKTNPDDLVTGIGGEGIIAVYRGNMPGLNIGIRADMDALPIEEKSDLPYRSQRKGVAHSCGHDGHTTIALGLASLLAEQRAGMSGSVTLIFQPAEETGTGAEGMLRDPKMKEFDYLFALHNLPGFERNSIIVRKGIFASSSIGVKVFLRGATSHAGHPEDGNSPVLAMTALIEALNSLPQYAVPLHRAALVTIIHSRLGEIAFGTTPGEAVVMATIRAHHNEDLEQMKKRLTEVVKGLGIAYSLETEIEWVEYFPALDNDEKSLSFVLKGAEMLSLPIIGREYPFSWSEDFAFFTERYPGVLFGIGAGLDHPQLHNSNYDFPDELIETGVNLFREIVKQTNLNGDSR